MFLTTETLFNGFVKGRSGSKYHFMLTTFANDPLIQLLNIFSIDKINVISQNFKLLCKEMFVQVEPSYHFRSSCSHAHLWVKRPFRSF